jgi:hypothetical protein
MFKIKIKIFKMNSIQPLASTVWPPAAAFLSTLVVPTISQAVTAKKSASEKKFGQLKIWHIWQI